MKKKIYRKAGAFLLLLVMVAGFSMTALADNLPCRSAKATGSYSDPETGVIEDAGGTENEDLGQSMVSNVVDSQALLEENAQGGYYESLRFHLASNLSDIQISAKKPGETDWKQVSCVQTGEGEDQMDLRFPVESEDSIVRAACHVEAMGRDVIFYVTLSDFTEGNAGGFVQLDSQDSALNGVTGLTTGGTGTVSSNNVAPAATLSVSSAATDPSEPQQLNLGGSVWWMLFAVVFCAHILAGLVLMGVRALLRRAAGRGGRTYDETETGEDMELSEEDWEDL